MNILFTVISNRNERFTPLLNESGVIEDAKEELNEKEKPLFGKNPYDEAGFFSKVFFTWVSPVIKVNIIWSWSLSLILRDG